MKTVKITHKGWYLFCPCYLHEGWETEEGLTIYPRLKLWGLLDWANIVCQFNNWLGSHFGYEGGFGVTRILQLSKPFNLSFKI